MEISILFFFFLNPSLTKKRTDITTYMAALAAKNQELFCYHHHNITLVCRSYLLDLDWTQRKKKEGTFVLDSPDTSRPSTGASSRPGLASALAEAKSRSSSLSRLPARKLTA